MRNWLGCSISCTIYNVIALSYFVYFCVYVSVCVCVCVCMFLWCVEQRYSLHHSWTNRYMLSLIMWQNWCQTLNICVRVMLFSLSLTLSLYLSLFMRLSVSFCVCLFLYLSHIKIYPLICSWRVGHSDNSKQVWITSMEEVMIILHVIYPQNTCNCLVYARFYNKIIFTPFNM